MKRVLSVVNIVAGSAVLTLAVAAGAMLLLMFRGDNSGDVHRTGLFGALEFRSVEQPDGAVDLTLGVSDPVPLLVVFVLVALWLVVVRSAYRFLRRRRAELLARQSLAGASAR